MRIRLGMGHRLPLGFWGSASTPVTIGRRWPKPPVSPGRQAAANILGILTTIGVVGWLTVTSGSLILVPGLVAATVWMLARTARLNR